MWFSLTTRILQHYLQEEEDKDETIDVGASPTPKRGRVSLKFSIPSTFKKRATQIDISDEFDTDIVSKSSGATAIKDESIVPKLPQLRDRRPPILTRHSELDLSSSCPVPNTANGSKVNDQLSNLYNIFQLSVEVSIT